MAEEEKTDPVRPITADDIEPLVYILANGETAKQTAAAKALKRLSIGNAENKSAIIDAGGVMPLVELSIDGSAEVQAHAASVLCNLATVAAGRVEIDRAGGIEPLAARAKKGCEAAVAALYNLMLHPSCARRVMRTGFPEQMVGMLPEGEPSVRFDELTDEQLATFEKAFKAVDKDGSGSISTNELGTLLRQLGQNPTEDDLRDLLAVADADGSGTLDFAEFVPLIVRMIERTSGEAENLQEAFAVFDREGTGSFPAERLRVMLKGLGEADASCMLPESEIDQMIRDADVDGDGDISFDEFVKAMMTPGLRP